jgi:hypothetical protein
MLHSIWLNQLLDISDIRIECKETVIENATANRQTLSVIGKYFPADYFFKVCDGNSPYRKRY